LLTALHRELCERKPLTMSQQQAEGNYSNERHQPEHDSATRSQFVWDVEDVLQRGDRGKL
jgi:hypothetical protein